MPHSSAADTAIAAMTASPTIILSAKRHHIGPLGCLSRECIVHNGNGEHQPDDRKNTHPTLVALVPPNMGSFGGQSQDISGISVNCLHPTSVFDPTVQGKPAYRLHLLLLSTLWTRKPWPDMGRAGKLMGQRWTPVNGVGGRS